MPLSVAPVYNQHSV